MADSASGVHKLAIPRHVTMVADRHVNAFGDGHHYQVTGYYPAGEPAFGTEVVGDLSAAGPVEAIDVVLRRFRERGW